MSIPEIRIGIVEDHALVRDLLRARLDSVADFDVVFDVSTVGEARVQFMTQTVNVALLDIDLPDGNGIGLGASLRRSMPELGIVLLSSKDMLELMLGLPEDVRRGWSYLSKGSTTNIEILTHTIRSAAKGIGVLDPGLFEGALPRTSSSIASLTSRQYEVLKYVAQGLSNQAIADVLGLSSNSIVNHLTAIYAALDIPEDSNTRVTATLRFLEESAREAL